MKQIFKKISVGILSLFLALCIVFGAGTFLCISTILFLIYPVTMFSGVAVLFTLYAAYKIYHKFRL